MAGCTLDHCQLGGAKWPSAVLRQARGSNVASWQQKSANRRFGMWNTPPKLWALEKVTPALNRASFWGPPAVSFRGV